MINALTGESFEINAKRNVSILDVVGASTPLKLWKEEQDGSQTSIHLENTLGFLTTRSDLELHFTKLYYDMNVPPDPAPVKRTCKNPNCTCHGDGNTS